MAQASKSSTRGSTGGRLSPVFQGYAALGHELQVSQSSSETLSQKREKKEVGALTKGKSQLATKRLLFSKLPSENLKNTHKNVTHNPLPMASFLLSLISLPGVNPLEPKPEEGLEVGVYPRPAD